MRTTLSSAQCAANRPRNTQSQSIVKADPNIQDEMNADGYERIPTGDSRQAAAENNGVRKF